MRRKHSIPQFRRLFALERIHDVEMCGRVIGHFQLFRIACDLLESTRKAVRVARGKNRFCIGVELPLPAHGQFDQLRDERREERKNNADDEENSASFIF